MLGLLSDAESLALICEPFQATLEKSPPAEAFRVYTGNHPYFLQLALWESWEAQKQDRAVNWRYFGHQLRQNYYQPLWNCRTPDEKTCLRHVADGGVAADNHISVELEQRGLLAFTSTSSAQVLRQAQHKRLRKYSPKISPHSCANKTSHQENQP